MVRGRTSWLACIVGSGRMTRRFAARDSREGACEKGFSHERRFSHERSHSLTVAALIEVSRPGRPAR